MSEKVNEHLEVYRDLQAETSSRYDKGAGKTIQHLIDGFNKLDTRVPEIFTGDKPFETRSGVRFKLVFDSWIMPKDTIAFDAVRYKKTSDHKSLYKIETTRNTLYNGELWPYDARLRKVSYMASLRMRIVKVDDEEEQSEPFEILKLPVMLRSELCYLSKKASIKTEDGEIITDPEEPHPSLEFEQESDVGGYFIILGREMILLLQDHSVQNRDLVLRTGPKKEFLVCQITIRHLSTTRQTSIVLEKTKNKEPRFLVNYHNARSVDSKTRGINLGDAFVLLGVKIEDVLKIFRLVHFGEGVSTNEVLAIVRDSLAATSPSLEKIKHSLQTTDREAYNLPAETGVKIAYENFLNDIFPQIKSNQVKACMLAYMTVRLIRVYLGKDSLDDQNKNSNKQFQSPAAVLEKLIQQLWRRIRQVINGEISNPSITSASAIANIIIAKSTFTNRIVDSFNTGRWGPENDPHTGVVEETTRELGIVSIINRLTRIVVTGGRKGGTVKTESRMVDPEQLGTVCLFTTPDSDQIGSTRNLTWTSRLSLEINGGSVVSSITRQLKNLLSPLHIRTTGENTGLIFVNAYPIGWGNLQSIFTAVRDLRRSGKVQHYENGVYKPYFELSLGIKDGCLWMNTSSGRPYTPRIIIYSEMVNVGGYEVMTQYTKPLGDKNWDKLLSTGVVEYIDAFELRHTVIADIYLTFLKNEDIVQERIELLRKLLEEGKDAEAQKLYADIKREEINNMKTHLSLDPTEIYALTAAMTPFANRIAGVRLALQSKMAAQAISHQSPQHRYYMGQKYRNLVYTSAPLICTAASARSQQEFGSGDQIIVAFISLQGNQEDSIIWRKGAIDTGKLMTEIYITEEVTSVNRGAVHKTLMRPFPRANEDLETYSHLGRDGVPEVGIPLREGQVVIGVATCEMGKCNNYMRLVSEYYTIEDEIETIQSISELEYEEDRRIYLQRWNVADKDLDQIELLKELVNKKSEKLKEIQDAPDQPRWTDSVVVPPKKKYTVDSAVIFNDAQGDLTVRVKLRALRRPREADKQNPRASQKATIGEIWRDEDMPYFYDGKAMMVPDVIVNSLAPFARQTNSWFLEMMTGLLDAIGGTRTDADAHRHFDIDWLFKRLREVGFKERSFPLISGTTGEHFGTIDAQTGAFAEASVFMGPSYQTSLKHQVQDKGQVRGIGKRDIQTGLGVKGRNTPAGIRFGGMEVVATETHGAAFSVLDRLRDSTAKVNKVICNICDYEAVFRFPNYYCRRCKNTDYNEFTQVEISKATDFTVNSIASANIIMTYKTDSKEFRAAEAPEEYFLHADSEEEGEEIEEEITEDEFDDYE